MPKKISRELTVDKLRWALDSTTLSFETTDDLKPLKEIIGQDRGLEAFRFGMGMEKQGYNVFVTGRAGSGRMSTVRKLLEEMSKKGRVPEDLAYVNNFKNIEAPILLRFKAGMGRNFKKDIHDLIESLKKEVPRLFESQDYLNRKKETMEDYEKKGKTFFKDLDAKVKEEGFTLVDLQMGQIKRPEVMPLVDGNPMHIDQVEALVEKGRFPKAEFEDLKKKEKSLREEISQIFLELRDLQKEIQQKIEEMDYLLFKKIAAEVAASLYEKYPDKSINAYLGDMLADMAENLNIFAERAQQPQQIIPVMPTEGDSFQPYQVNLLVDNADQEAPPVNVESYPTYRNLFGSIERVVDRSGIWKTDFSKIKAGSFVKASGGYLVLNLLDALVEPGVWQALKRSLKTKKMEIQTYDPFYLFTTSGLKPEPIEIDTKVIVISDEYIYHLLLAFDDDVKKIFKVRADFNTSMDKNRDSIQQFGDFIKMRIDADGLRPFDRTAVAALIEEAVRMAGRQEKITTSFPSVADLIRESDYWAGQEDAAITKEKHVEEAIRAKIYRSGKIEEGLQEMIDRGTLMIDVDGEVVGQVNGLAVYDVGDYMFGKPSRITSTISMGRAGIVNIEREADMSGKTHNKGVLILTGFLREKFSQDRPLTMSASIAFEQSYGGVDGDSASSTEVYALLSSLSGIPIKQNIAVTGSVNQKGEVQAIGGVNQKVEGFYDCCIRLGLTGQQGVMIPDGNLKDLMLRKDVIGSVKKGEFHVYAVKTIDEGIEILTGKKAGKIKADGTYPKGSINYLVSEKLSSLAEGLKKFGDKEEENNKKGSKRKKANN